MMTDDNTSCTDLPPTLCRSTDAFHSTNLTVGTGCHVQQVVCQGNKCVGVLIRSSATPSSTIFVRSSKETILCAGAVQTPQILLLSGIGDAKHLREVDIAPVVDLPGVGQNLQDHLLVPMVFPVKGTITVQSW